MQPIAETVVPIVLSGQTYKLYFDCNSMAAFEEKTGKFFLGVVSDLFDAVFPNGQEPKTPRPSNPLEIVKKVSMVDLRALLWSAMHEYDKDDEPHWPMTISQVGRLLKMQDVVPVFTAFLQGQSGNSPSKEELGESQGAAPKPNGSVSLPITADAGGEAGIELPASAFA